MNDNVNGMEINCCSRFFGNDHILTFENATPADMACFIGSQDDLCEITISRKDEDTPFLTASQCRITECTDKALGRQVNRHLKMVRRLYSFTPHKLYDYEDLKTILAFITPAWRNLDILAKIRIRRRCAGFSRRNWVPSALQYVETLVISTAVYFACGYLNGMIVKWIIGGMVASVLNLLFDTQRFTPDAIPVLCATLSTIGSLLKSIRISPQTKPE